MRNFCLTQFTLNTKQYPRHCQANYCIVLWHRLCVSCTFRVASHINSITYTAQPVTVISPQVISRHELLRSNRSQTVSLNTILHLNSWSNRNCMSSGVCQSVCRVCTARECSDVTSSLLFTWEEKDLQSRSPFNLEVCGFTDNPIRGSGGCFLFCFFFFGLYYTELLL